MALVYRPNALYMSPKNESVDVTNGVNFSFTFKGYQMNNAIGQLYQNSNIGEWTKLGNSFDFASGNAPYYNNQKIEFNSNSNTNVQNNMVNNANSVLGWGVTVYGIPSTQNATANNRMVPSVRGFESGDTVAVYTGSGTTTPYYFNYIGSYDSKLSLGTVNTGTDAEGTDINNTFSVSEAVYINLTTGDKIQESKSSTAYYIYKVNEGASNPIGYYIKVYDTLAHAQAGGTTGIITTAVANKTFYVNAVIVTNSNTFYVGVVGGNVITLYTTKEASLQGVEEAIVTLTNGSTYTIQAFENSQIVQFTPLIANSIVFDLDDVYGTNRGVTLTLSDNNIYTYSSANTLFTGQQLTATNGTDNKTYYIRVWENNPNTLSLFTNRQAALGNNSTYLTLLDSGYNNVYLSEVLQNNKTFTVGWADENNIPMITSWEAILYSVKFDDTNNIKSRNIIEKSGIQYNGNVKYEFEHLLLSFASNLGAKDSSNFGRYMVEFNLVDSTGFEYTGSLLFDVGYEVAFTSYSPSAIVNNCDSSVSVQWDNAVAIKGESQDGGVGQIKDYLYAGNYGALINQNNSVTYDVNIPENSFPTFLFQPSAGFNGTIVSLDGDTESAVLRYDVIAGNGVFTFSITTKALGSTVNTIVNTDVNLLDNSKVYLIGYAEGEIYIREYADASGALTETSASGTTINIDGTVYHEPLDITLQGNTTQDGTPTPTSPIEVVNVKGDNEVKVVGKNLQDISLRDNLSSITFSGVTLDYNATKFRIHGTATASGGRTTLTLLKTSLTRGTYTISAQNIAGTIGTLYGYLHNSSNTIIGMAFGFVGTTTSTTVTVTESGEYYIGFNVTSGETYDVYFNIQLEHGTTQTTYEPYTEQSYPINLPVENLWNNEKAVTDSNNAEVYIDGEWLRFRTGSARLIYNIESTERLTFQAIFKSEVTTENIIAIQTFYTDGTNDRLLALTTTDTEEHFVTATTTAGKTVSYFRSVWSSDKNALAKNIQLEKSSVANTYTPYGTTPIELNKIGDYQDYLYKSGDKWYVHKEINKVTLNGTENWTRQSPSHTTVLNSYTPSYTWLTPKSADIGYSNFVVFSSLAGANNDSLINVAKFNTSYSNLLVDLSLADFNTEIAFKTYLESHPMYIYYPLATATNTEITYTPLINQLNEIEKATSYDGVTNILQDNSGNPFMLEVQSSSYK